MRGSARKWTPGVSGPEPKRRAEERGWEGRGCRAVVCWEWVVGRRAPRAGRGRVRDPEDQKARRKKQRAPEIGVRAEARTTQGAAACALRSWGEGLLWPGFFRHLALGSPVQRPNGLSGAPDGRSCQTVARESPGERGGVAESLAVNHGSRRAPSGSGETVRRDWLPHSWAPRGDCSEFYQLGAGPPL